MRVESLRRYPVKSMLGETVDSLFVDEGGAAGDRRLALVDPETGYVASAKTARLSRRLGRTVRLVSQRPLGATLERPDPEQLLELGLDAEVSGRILEIAQATP